MSDLREATVEVHTPRGVFPTADLGEGPAVVLLHGFPDTRLLWADVADDLVAAGYRVVAPDQRGFGGAPQPQEVAAYERGQLRADVEAVLDVLSVDRYAVVGHDWGTAIAGGLAARFRDRVTHLGLLSVGIAPPDAWWSVEQRRASWYFEFFQHRGVAEQWLELDDHALLREWLAGQHPDPDEVIARLREPGALTAALNWYRGTTDVGAPPPEQVPAPRVLVRCPTLAVWGADDPFLTEPVVARSDEQVAPGRCRYVRLDGVGHWIPTQAPAVCSRLLLELLAVEDVW